MYIRVEYNEIVEYNTMKWSNGIQWNGRTVKNCRME